MSYNLSLQTNNAEIQELISIVNALPDAGGVELPDLTNPGNAGTLLDGYELIDQEGKVITGTIPTKDTSDLFVMGKAVLVPSGYYIKDAYADVKTTTQATPTISVNSSGLITATAIQSEGYVNAGTISEIKQLTTQATKTITPTKSEQTAVSSGVYTTGAIKVAPIPDKYIDSSDATSDVNEVFLGETFYANGEKKVGTFTIESELSEQDELLAELEEILNNKSAAGGEANPVLQSKTVSPTTSSQTVTADSGYDGLSDVTVNAIPSEYVVPTGTLPITENGTYDVKNYESATVNVAGSGGGSSEDTEILNGIVSGNITSYSNNTATAVRDGLFMRCTKLTAVSFPAATKINQYAFYQCSSLTTISFPTCVTVGENAFGFCSNIVNINLPVCTTVGMSAFGSCYKLLNLSLPQCTSVANYAIARCSVIETINLPACQTIGVSAFRENPKLTTVSIPAAKSIPAGTFSKCFNLKSLYLTGSILCTLANSNAFASTPIGGYSASAKAYGTIYVPASMLASYQAATNWTYFSSRMVGI